MTRVHKGKRSVPKLVCVAAKTGRKRGGKAVCVYRAVRVEVVEDAIANGLCGHVLPHAPLSDANAEAALKRIEAGLDGLSDMIERAYEELLRKNPPKGLKRKLASLETARDELVAQRDDALAKIDQRAEAVVGTRIADLANVLDNGPLHPPSVNAALRRVFSHVTVLASEGLLDFSWRHVDGATTALLYAMPTIE
jgi:hypothetical protein